MSVNGNILFDNLKQRLLPYPAVASAVPKYLEQGRIGIGTGINQNRMGTVYPFVEKNKEVFGLVADVSLQYPTDLFTPPFTIKRIHSARGGIGNVPQYADMTIHDWLDLSDEQLATFVPANYITRLFPRVVVIDANKNTVIDTDLCTTRGHVPSRDLIDDEPYYDTYFWKTDNGQIQFYYTEYIAANELDYPLIFPYALENCGILVSRCCFPSPNPVRLKEPTTNAIIQQEPILELIAGKDVTISVDGQRIIINAANPERYSDGELRIPFKTINGTPPDSKGNFRILGDKCFHIGRAVENAEVIPSTLKIRNDCTPCCSCETYAEIYKTTTQLRDIISSQIETLTNMRQRYDMLRAQYDNRINDILMKSVQVIATVTDKKSLINFGVSNVLNKQADNLICLIEFYGIGFGSQAIGVVESFHQNNLAVPLSGSWPFFYFNISKIVAFKDEYFRLALNFPSGKKGQVISFCISVYHVDNPVTSTIIQSPVPDRPWGNISSGIPYLFGEPVCTRIELTGAGESNVTVAPSQSTNAV
jgi:hypothetical protein